MSEVQQGEALQGDASQGEASPPPNPFDNLPQSRSLQGLPPSAQHLHDLHDDGKAQYNKLKKADNQLKALTEGLTRLAKLADTITAEDVVDEAAKIIKHGISSEQMASILADMPADGGEALAGWVKQMLEVVTGNRAKLAPALAAARHQMGVAALHSIIGHQIDFDGRM